MSTPSHRVPRSTHVLMVSVMLLFFSLATLITLQGKFLPEKGTWMWWLIPLAMVVVIVVILAERIVRRSHHKRMIAELQRP